MGPRDGIEGFDGTGAHSPAAGWVSESTGGSGPTATWAEVADDQARSAPRVLALTAVNHGSEDRFNLHWSPAMRFADGRISVWVRANDGEFDQGGGPAWRIQDASNYYVCRINPLEANLRVYVVHGGVRRQLATALVDAAAGRWYRLEIEHVGQDIVCSLDGRAVLHASDATIERAGGVGLWTKADARSAFDDLAVREHLP